MTMKKAGFRCVNDEGTVQIDESYANLMMVYKGTATDWNDYAPGDSPTCSFATISITGVNPLIAFTTASKVTLFLRQKDGDSFTFTLMMIGSGAGKSVDFYIFDTNPPESAAGLGTIVRNGAGDIIYDSSRPLMQIVDFASGGGPGGSPVVKTYSAGRTYAVIPSVNGFSVQNFIYVTIFYGHFYTTAPGQVTASPVGTVISGVVFSFVPSNYAWGAIVVDVTGY